EVPLTIFSKRLRELIKRNEIFAECNRCIGQLSDRRQIADRARKYQTILGHSFCNLGIRGLTKASKNVLAKLSIRVKVPSGHEQRQKPMISPVFSWLQLDALVENAFSLLPPATLCIKIGEVGHRINSFSVLWAEGLALHFDYLFK